MTPAEITQTRRMLNVARRNYVHYSMKVRGYHARNEQPPYEFISGAHENDQLMKQYERELSAAA
jgi:hypothetical protein